MKRALAIASMTMAFSTYSSAQFNLLEKKQGLENNLSEMEVSKKS